jgi:hypothetical protein
MDNTKLISVFPELKLKETAYGKFLSMIQEKTLSNAETKKKEEIVKSMKKSASDFEERYPGRGKEVMYATATKQAKKVAEEAECDTEKKDDEEDPRSMKTKVNLVKTKLRSMGLKMSYEPEGESIDELNRYEKETGKDYKTQKPSVKGGTAKNDKAFQIVSKLVGKSRLGATQRGKKKVKGGPTPGPVITTKQKLDNKKYAIQAGKDNMSSRFD